MVIKEFAKEITGREAESALKGGKHHNFICIGCRMIFANGGTPLQHDTVWVKVVCNKFVNLTFICDGRLKQVRVRGGLG
jgi:hypothetical protein